MYTCSPPLPDDGTIEPERQAEPASWAQAIADAELEAGLYVDATEMRSWIMSIDTNRELPLAPIRQR